MPDPSRRAAILFAAFVVVLFAATGSAQRVQNTGDPESPAAAGADAAKTASQRAANASALLHWVAAFEAGHLQVQGRVHIAPESRVDYVRIALEGGALAMPERPVQTSHFTLLQRLVTAAEKDPSADAAQALLALAATGFAGDMFNHRTMMVRDLGHFALLRMESASVWNHIHEVATTEVVMRPEDSDFVAIGGVNGPTFDRDDTAMWRIAAIRLLGMKGKGVFRSSIEKCLLSKDGRVRLAAAESLGFLHHAASLPVVTQALGTESHPMTVVALVQAIQRILNKHAESISLTESELALRTALDLLGQASWRADMAIVQLVQNHPLKDAVPKLIALMRLSRGEKDPILKIINRHASRFLGVEAHRALKKITGAVIPEDPGLWQAFWEKEKDKIAIQRRSSADRTKTFATMRGASFYGIPILGNQIMFVIDTSGSMKTRVEAKVPRSGSRGTSARPITMRGSRLSIAKRQTLKAIQGMPKHASFSIVTFSGTARAWNRKPVKAATSARNVAARIMGRLQPKGGTNVFDALMLVLQADHSSYGEKPGNDVDEVFVLSDGMPTGGGMTDPDEILRVVGEINKVRRVRIHTVFAGDGRGAEFMRKLAEQNNGIFVQQ